MKIGIAILCRLTSTRLPQKHLREISGRTVIGHIMDRVQSGIANHPVVVATSSDPSDDTLANYCRRSKFSCFRGSLEDVAERFLTCAEYYGWDYIVRINGDNLFADPDTLRSMLAIAETNQYDFITNVPGRTFPFGVTVEIVRVAFYRNIIQNFTSSEHREHVTLWLYENEKVGKRYVYKNSTCPEIAGQHLALDTAEDFRRYSKMINRMDRSPSSYNLADIARLAKEPEPINPWNGKFGPMLIAEIGGNHEGNFDVAKDLAQKAIDCGVDYVKFQLYRGDTLVSPVESPDRNKHFKKFELSQEQHVELALMCKNSGVGYLASVWDLEMLNWIDPNLTMYKIGSGDLTAWPIIREFARRGKPIILSTGLATMDEILQTVAQIQAVDNRYCHPEWLCLLQCTSMYPIIDEEANLRVMDTLRQTTGLAVGYSDHTKGRLALRTAAAMGANVLEFHFTDTREDKGFRDHKVSLTSEEVSSLQDDIYRINNLRGDNVKKPQQSEINTDHITSFRRAVYVNKVIEKGDIIHEDDLVFLRPNHGIDARDTDILLASKACNPLVAYQNISLEEIEKNGAHND